MNFILITRVDDDDDDDDDDVGKQVRIVSLASESERSLADRLFWPGGVSPGSIVNAYMINC